MERLANDRNEWMLKEALADGIFRPSARARAALLETPPPAPRQQPPPQIKKKRSPATFAYPNPVFVLADDSRLLSSFACPVIFYVTRMVPKTLGNLLESRSPDLRHTNLDMVAAALPESPRCGCKAL